MSEEKQKHLEIIQGVITRMANNSFLLKGWTVTLLAGLSIATTLIELKYLLIILAIPTLAFWGLDSYYLRQERLFRKLYEEARNSYYVKDSNFSIFSMDTSPYNSKVDTWIKVLISKTEIWFYLPIYLVTSILYIISE
jgi:hypothetical protein